MIRLGFGKTLRYAPTAGRLAAAIATNCAMPRLMRSCADRSNELTRCIKNPSAPEEKILSRSWRQRENGPP
jgi:hypothetical protein